MTRYIYAFVRHKTLVSNPILSHAISSINRTHAPNVRLLGQVVTKWLHH